MHSQTVDTACLMSEVSLGHIDTCGTHRVCLHATLSGGHLGGFTHHTPAWQTPYRHPTTGSATALLTVGLHASTTLEVMHSQTVDTACLMSEVSLGHIDTCGTHRVCLHATLSGGHLG